MNDKNLIFIIFICKFYFLFENLIYKDYIIEKFYNVFLVGLVFVVLGLFRENYENYILVDLFIYVEDFNFFSELVKYLKEVDKNNKLYFSYFNWRKDFIVNLLRFWELYVCLVCDYVKRY